MLSKSFKLINNSDFQQVYSARKTISGDTLRLSFDFNADHFQLGVVTGKKVGEAHQRNLVRRRISEIFQKECSQYLSQNIRLVVVTKPGITKLTYQQLHKELEQMLTKIHFPKVDYIFKRNKGVEALLKSKKEDLLVVADFDRTLSKAYTNGVFQPSLISILRTTDILGTEFVKSQIADADHYLPIEKDMAISVVEKTPLMNEWWDKAFIALLKAGLRQSHFQQMLDTEKVVLRELAPEFLKLLSDNNIPLVIISASPIGEIIQEFLERNNCLYPNIYFVTNSFNWEEGVNDPKMLSVKQPFIFNMNKNKVGIEKYDFYSAINKKKNLILLGDSFDDINMAENFQYENILKVGILSKHSEANREKFQKEFDLVILDDGSLKPVYEIVKNLA